VARRKSRLHPHYGAGVKLRPPMKIFGAFPRLRLKPGLMLRAYVYEEGGNGNGVVWAMPENLPFPQPFTAGTEQAQELPTPFGWPHFLGHPPIIPGCLPDLMTALLGDGSPESYLEASVFVRETGEFGAQWHGCNWSTHSIVGNDSWNIPGPEHAVDQIPSLNSWKWLASPPEVWDPTVTEDGDSVIVRFVTYTGLGRERLCLHGDTYRRYNYECQHNTENLAIGSGGYIF